MSDHDLDEHRTVEGAVIDIFAHRFVLETNSERILCDLTPSGAGVVTLRRGDRVRLTGIRNPSELKVTRISMADGRTAAISHATKHDREAAADPAVAVRAVRDAGYTLAGEPKRKPKHFEILGRQAGGDLQKLHVEFDGRIRKTKPVAPDEAKSVSDLALAP